MSINCHGFQYFSRQRPPKNTSATFQIITNKKENDPAAHPAYPGRIAWARKSRRLDGLFLVGMELGIPLNIWDVDEVPEDWAAFSPPTAEDPASFLIEVDRFLHFARSATYYQLLGVKSNATRSEVKRRFYQLARRFHPDHHMDRPELTSHLVSLMEGLTTAYETLSDEESKKNTTRFSRADPKRILPKSGNRRKVIWTRPTSAWRKKTLPEAFCGCTEQSKASRILRATGPCWGGACPPFLNTGGKPSSNLRRPSIWIPAISSRICNMGNYSNT